MTDRVKTRSSNKYVIMSESSSIWLNGNLDHLVDNLGILKDHVELTEITHRYLSGDYQQILNEVHAQKLFRQYLERLSKNEGFQLPDEKETEEEKALDHFRTLIVGLAAFNAFLQANVTGPPITMETLLFSSESSTEEIRSSRERFLSSLSVDGLSVYQHIPHVELFCFARGIFTNYFPRVIGDNTMDSKWMRIRINAYHQRLLSSGPSNTRLSDFAPELQAQIEADIFALEQEIFGANSIFSTEVKTQFLLEKAQIYIMQGIDSKARENIHRAKTISKFNYELSGALGKRTKFQEKDTSQLVVLAKSKETGATEDASNHPSESSLSDPGNASATNQPNIGPTALELNDDTLLESIEFSKSTTNKVENSILPPELLGLEPDKQPQLYPLDQIILLAEATLKDTFSPLDGLNSEEILPYAVRVLTDKPTNWQIYTQALLVRSRIEAHRSRTQERSVLQLQAIVDQIVADTEEEAGTRHDIGIPQVQVTQFLPRAKSSEFAPVNERLKYIFQLNTPTRWEIETELAYGWTAAGSLVSALEIFKRLRLWAEVALCYHSVGQEDKARQIVRRQLYHSALGPAIDASGPDTEEALGEQWDGDIRSPPPPHAPRLWCILGDLDQDPSCWQRAWSISGNRYARAQRTLGQYYVQRGELEKARESYIAAAEVNRQNAETWGRLGDIDLRLENWDGAIIAYQQSIMIDETDAKTYSNLGSALYSKYTEALKKGNAGSFTASNSSDVPVLANDGEEISTSQPKLGPKPSDLLLQSLNAYKRAASLAPTNWRIWDNVLTLALRSTPLPLRFALHAFHTVLKIRGPATGETAIDLPALTALVDEAVSQAESQPPPPPPSDAASRRTTCLDDLDNLVSTSVLPLLTTRSDVYPPLAKLARARLDSARALAYAEAAWRMATRNDGWLESCDWREVADRTEELLAAIKEHGADNWRAKTQSALRAVLGKARRDWGDSDDYARLAQRLQKL